MDDESLDSLAAASLMKLSPTGHKSRKLIKKKLAVDYTA